MGPAPSTVEPRIVASRVRAMLHMMAELRERPRHEDVRAAYLEASAGLLGADLAALCVMPAHSALEVEDVMLGFDSPELQALYEDIRTGRCVDPAMRAIVRTGVGVARRCELVDDATWYADPIVQRRLAAGVDDALLCVRPLPDGRLLGVGYHRRVGAPRFSLEDLAVAEVLEPEAAWLLRDVTRADRLALARLSRRERQTLELLVQGRSEKEAAAELDVSPSTLHTYVKRLYRRLRVRSRPELMALALLRNA